MGSMNEIYKSNTTDTWGVSSYTQTRENNCGIKTVVTSDICLDLPKKGFIQEMPSECGLGIGIKKS